MRGLFCPECKKDEHLPEFEKDGLYVCATCNKVLGYLCYGCDKVFLENRLTLHKNVYICKECGNIQWGYTEWKNR